MKIYLRQAIIGEITQGVGYQPGIYGESTFDIDTMKRLVNEGYAVYFFDQSVILPEKLKCRKKHSLR
jgi:hypothetical protein